MAVLLKRDDMSTVLLKHDDLPKLNGRRGVYEGLDGTFAYDFNAGLYLIPSNPIDGEPVKNIFPGNVFTVFEASDISLSYLGVPDSKLTCICLEKPGPDTGRPPDEPEKRDSPGLF
jgi:hypothetical protein